MTIQQPLETVPGIKDRLDVQVCLMYETRKEQIECLKDVQRGDNAWSMLMWVGLLFIAVGILGLAYTSKD